MHRPGRGRGRRRAVAPSARGRARASLAASASARSSRARTASPKRSACSSLVWFAHVPRSSRRPVGRDRRRAGGGRGAPRAPRGAGWRRRCRTSSRRRPAAPSAVKPATRSSWRTCRSQRRPPRRQRVGQRRAAGPGAQHDVPDAGAPQRLDGRAGRAASRGSPGHARSRRRPAAAAELRGRAPPTVAAVVSEIFDPPAWQAVPGFDFTDITYHRRASAARARCGSRSTGPRCATPSGRTPSTSCYRALDHARMSTRRRLRAAHRQRPVAEGRRLGVLLRRRPAHPRPRRLPVRRRARPPTPSTRPRAGRLHILEVQRLIRFMPKVVICRGPRLGGRRRAQPARGLRPDPRQRASTPGSSRPTPTSARFDGGYGSAYLARQVGQKFAREIFFLGRDVHRRGRRTRMGAVNARRRRTPTSRRRRCEWAARDQRQAPDGAADAEVRLQPRSTTAWSASSCSPARRPGWPT